MTVRGYGMRPKKPCAQCGHGKSKHRKREWAAYLPAHIIWQGQL